MKNEDSKKRKFCNVLFLTLNFCYIFRIQHRELRKTYKQKIIEIIEKRSYFMTIEDMNKCLEDEYSMYLDNMDI